MTADPTSPTIGAAAVDRSAVGRSTGDLVLDAVAALLRERTWSSITMTDVAAAAGVSRQTVYNEFGNRQGLVTAYAVRLGERFAGLVAEALRTHEGDVRGALLFGFRAFVVTMSVEPLVIALSAESTPDLLRLVTVDSAVIRERAGAILAETLHTGWIGLDEAAAESISRTIVRLALSYVSMPPEPGRDPAESFADLFAPYLQAAVAG